MTATVTGATFTTAAAANLLDARYGTVVRWAKAMFPSVGTGSSYRLAYTDLMVLRAWCAITHGDLISRGSPPDVNAHLRRLAETAIRAEPRRWLLLGNDGAATHDTAEEAAAELLNERWRHRLIDLEPWSDGGDT